MKIALFAYGSRGDFEPFVALAVGLQKAGHEVILAGPHRFAGFAAEQGVPFAPLAGDPEEVSKRINDAGGNVYRVVTSIRDFVFSVADEVSRASFAAAEGADLLVHSFLFTTGMHSWAREHGIADVSVQLFPTFAPTRAFPNPAMAQVPPGALSYLTHWLTTQVMWYGGNSGYKPALAAHPEIAYPRRLYWPFSASGGRPRTPLLFAYSPTVLARPAEWRPDVHVTGYFFLEDAAYQPPEELTRFLEAGAAPVCVTFGSMINREADKIHQAVTEALARRGQRAVFLTGWGAWERGEARENILYLPAAPHGWLLPRCKAVIHHGGAGTTAAGLRAGIPSLVIPHTADQPFWGKRVQALGAGPAPMAVGKVSAARLEKALAEMDDPAMAQAAKRCGEMIRAEDGVGRAVEIIEAQYERIRAGNP